ncbi:MAG TPA: ABC transporter substrate-binding protein [Candidatus Lustribacter sp.]
MNRAKFVIEPILTGLLAAAVGAARVGAQAFGTLDAAGPPNDTGALLFYAADMGFYRKAGLDVKVTALNNSGAISSAIASGAVQVGSFAVSVGALAREKGLPLVMIAPAGLYLSTAPTSGLIVLKDSPIRAASDLNGKTIATRDISNMSYFGAKQWIDKNGGDSKTVRWIEISDTSDAAALKSKRIDAATVSEPALDDAVRGGEIRSLAPIFDAISKRFLISGYFTSEDFATSHPDVVRRFADIIAGTAHWANGNRPATARILEKYAQAPVLPGSTRVTYAERLAASDVQPVLDLLHNYGLLKTPMHAKDMFSPLVSSQ